MHPSIRRLHFLLRVSVALLAGLSFLSIFTMTLGFDEAWLISRYGEIVKGEKLYYKMAPSSMTNGGVFILAGTLLYALFGAKVWAYRLFSFACLLLVTLLLRSWSRARWGSGIYFYVQAAVLWGMWGTVQFGASGYGCIPAMLLLLFGLHFLGKREQLNWRTCLLAGLFFGLASASRLNFLAIFPALFAEAFVSPQGRKQGFRQAFLLTAGGALGFLLSAGLLLLLSPDSSQDLWDKSLYYSGVGGSLWLDYPRILNKWTVANGFLPLFVMTAVTAYAFLSAASWARTLRILVLFGWIHWCAWLLRAPIAHLRYFWPTIASFSVVGGFALSEIYRWAEKKGSVPVCATVLFVALSFSALGFVNGFRALIHGETNIISWEWSRETPLADYRWYRYKPYQDEMAEYLAAHVEEGQEVGVIGLDLELELLSGVKVVPMSYYYENDLWDKEDLPRKILITPMIGTYLYLNPYLFPWMEKNLSKEVQFGRYILYNVEGSYPDSPEIFKFSHTPHPGYPGSDPFFQSRFF